jgi:6-phosphofructo-2-kinase/fructose-2,6-biphosphatase 2
VEPVRRKTIFDGLREVMDADRIIFIEIIRDEGPYLDAILEQHITRSASYSESAHDEAKADYCERIQHYKRVYQSIGDEYAYIKITNDSEGVEMNNVRGYLPTRVVNYLCQLNLNFKPIYCSRHGESEYNLLAKLGGDSNLSEEGTKYSQALKEYITDLKSKLPPGEDIEIWTSTLKRTRQTVAPLQELGFKVVHWRALDEINAGVCDGLTYEEVAERMPEEFAKREKDKYNYRYPKGESYHDLIQRIEPVMMELERVKKVVLIVCHQAVLRCMYAYLMELLPVTCVRNEIPLHTVFKIASSSTGEMSCDKVVLMAHSGKGH